MVVTEIVLLHDFSMGGHTGAVIRTWPSNTASDGKEDKLCRGENGAEMIATNRFLCQEIKIGS